MNRVLSLVLSGLVLAVLSVGLFRLAFPAPPRSSPGMPAVDGVDGPTPTPGKRVSPGERLPSVDSLRLVHAPTDTGPGAPSSTAREREAASPGTKFPVTDLPFRLIGTVIGPSGYRAAVIEHTDSGVTRRLLPGRSWESLLVRRVEEERIHIQNTRRNRLEVLYLARTDTAPGKNGGEQARPARSEDDENRASRERPTRRSRSEDRPTHPERKRRKNREAMQKLQEILKERRNR